MSLEDVLQNNRVVVTVGSGGVGKTTTAAALAVHAATQGQRVLCLTIDPARRLANSLGLSEMTTSEQEVPARLFEEANLPLPEGGRLAAMMLDTKSTFDELVRNHASSPESRDRILNNRIYQYVAGSLAGTGEYMAMEKLHAVRPGLGLGPHRPGHAAHEQRARTSWTRPSASSTPSTLRPCGGSSRRPRRRQGRLRRARWSARRPPCSSRASPSSRASSSWRRSPASSPGSTTSSAGSASTRPP